MTFSAVSRARPFEAELTPKYTFFELVESQTLNFFALVDCRFPSFSFCAFINLVLFYLFISAFSLRPPSSSSYSSVAPHIGLPEIGIVIPMMAAQPWTASRPTGVSQYYGIAATRMYENSNSGSLQAAMPASVIKNYANSNIIGIHNPNEHVNTIQTRQASSSTQSSIASSFEFPNPSHLLHQPQQNRQHALSNQWAYRAHSSAVYPDSSHNPPNPNLGFNPTCDINNSPAVSVFPQRNSGDLQGVEDNDDDFFDAPEQTVRRL